MSVVIAHLNFGPFDGERLILPTARDDPWSRLVIPKFSRIQVQFIYLRAGRLEESDWAYLWDDSFTGVVD